MCHISSGALATRVCHHRDMRSSQSTMPDSKLPTQHNVYSRGEVQPILQTPQCRPSKPLVCLLVGPEFMSFVPLITSHPTYISHHRPPTRSTVPFPSVILIWTTLPAHPTAQEETS